MGLYPHLARRKGEGRKDLTWEEQMGLFCGAGEANELLGKQM